MSESNSNIITSDQYLRMVPVRCKSSKRQEEVNHFPIVQLYNIILIEISCKWEVVNILLLAKTKAFDASIQFQDFIYWFVIEQ